MVLQAQKLLTPMPPNNVILFIHERNFCNTQNLKMTNFQSINFLCISEKLHKPANVGGELITKETAIRKGLELAHRKRHGNYTQHLK